MEMYFLRSLSPFTTSSLHIRSLASIYSYEEIAFCSLACQTRALLIVAEGHKQQDPTLLYEQPNTISQGEKVSPLTSIVRGGAPTSPLDSRLLLQQGSPVTRALGASLQVPPTRPPLQARHSVAGVDNLVSTSHLSAQHPVMAALKSNMFNVSSTLQSGSRAVNGGSWPKIAEDIQSTISRGAALPSSGGEPSSISPSFFTSPMQANCRELEPLPTTEALYRQHYPKFANRRHFRDISPNKSRIPDSSSSSTISDVQLLTPPSVLRPILVLPDSQESMLRRDPTTQATHAETSTKHPFSHDVTLASHILPPISHHSSPLRHTPERQSAPKRLTDFTSSQTQSRGMDLDELLSEADQAVSPPASRPGLLSHGSEQSDDPVFTRGNSLGLEIQHVETTRTPEVTTTHFPSKNLNGNQEVTNEKPLKSSVGKSINPVLSPKNRYRLNNVHTAPTGGRRDSNDGWRSVEASRYTLGPREASYIVRKLAEEQKKRQQKERAAREDPLETRGRSRVRRRAGSWDNPLDTAQVRSCQYLPF
jgi:hypothetical protein